MQEISFKLPNTQINFAAALRKIRKVYLQDALSATAASMDIETIDRELHQYADHSSLQMLARKGLRGELLFAVPCLFMKNPYLLGYYRLLLGYSQKEFYTSATGAGIFKSMEEKGRLSQKQRDALSGLCGALNLNAKYMLENFITDMIDSAFFDQLTLLTLGPQLRGGANVQRGTSAITQIFDVVLQIVKSEVTSTDSHHIELINKSGRTVSIQFAADPDIVIREELAPGNFKNLVAIEVKGGQDYSNIHNRVGEAEKSHQKAKKDGYIECWTVINVDRIDIAIAKKESPTTNKFYRISELVDESSHEHKDFSMQICSIVGI